MGPALYDGTTPVEPPATEEEGYHLTEDLADRACSWVRQQKALMPDKPFLVYFARVRRMHRTDVRGVGGQVTPASSTMGWDVQRIEPSEAGKVARGDPAGRRG